MAQKDRSTFNSDWADAGGGFPTNSVRYITALILRNFVTDMKDSVMFLDDNFIDEDSFASDSATKAPSQQSVKAYVDSIAGISGLTTSRVPYATSPSTLGDTHLVYQETSTVSQINENTSDGSDNHFLLICGGGGSANTRGAILALNGNESASNAGYASLSSGVGVGGYIQLVTDTGVKIATTGASPHASAKLDVASTTKGFLPPRMTGTEAEAISSPAEGLMVYSTDGSGSTITTKGWWGYDGTNWVKLN